MSLQLFEENSIVLLYLQQTKERKKKKKKKTVNIHYELDSHRLLSFCLSNNKRKQGMTFCIDVQNCCKNKIDRLLFLFVC